MTKTRKISRTALCIAWLSGAAGALDTVSAQGLCDDPDASIATEPCLDTQDAQTRWRCIGRLADADNACPLAPAGWTRSKLFEIAGQPLPAGLGEFCLYDRTSGGSDESCADLQQLPLSQLDADVMVAVGMAGPAGTLKELVATPFRDHFYAQAGRPGTYPVDSNPKVRIGIVDTQVDSLQPFLEPQSLSPHGHTLLPMARDLVCLDGPNCGIEVTTTLGLPYTCFEEAECLALCGAPNGCPDPVGGGFVGTPSSVAAAIRREVSRWQASPTQRLVINLSLGWNPLFDLTPGGLRRVTSQALQAALEYASCHGALIVAAAGNPISGPERPQDPLAPGELEQLSAPDFAQCQAALTGDVNGPDAADFPAGAARPLLHAAGAVRADNSRVQARLDGEPALVAYGDHSVGDTTPGPLGASVTATQSGTSTAALVLTASAAAAWYHDPGLAPVELIGLVQAAGRPLSRLAEFCLGGPPCAPVRRVSVCASVAAVCDSTGMACPSAEQLACSAPMASQPTLPVDALTALYDTAADEEFDISALTEATAFPDCAPDYVLHHAAGADLSAPCPQRQYYGIQATPWAKGQPNGQNCEDCQVMFASPGTVLIEINADFEAAAQDTTLVCGDDAYRIGGQVTPGDLIRFTGLPFECRHEALRLAHTVLDGSSDAASVAGPLLVLQPDADNDGMQDDVDNCQLSSNPSQGDADGDGFGNHCDADLNGDCTINFVDLNLMKAAFFSADPVADLDESGSVDFADLAIMKSSFFGPPGPSALPNACR